MRLTGSANCAARRGSFRRANAQPCSVWCLRPNWGWRQNLLFRSHKQHPASTCNLSVDGHDPWVRVRGCPWLSVVVDVPTDVDRDALWSGSGRRSAGCETSDSGSGVSEPLQRERISALTSAYLGDGRVSILAVGFVARCDVVGISSRRGSSPPAQGVGRKVCSPALRPTPWAGSRLGAP